MRKRIIAWLVSLVLVASIISSDYMSIGVKAATTVVYDANNMSTFSSRTAQSVANKYSQYRYSTNTYNNGDRNSWFTTMPSTSNPYSAGVASADTHKAMSDMTNFYRWLVGVDEFDVASQHSDSLQAQALIRNFQFSHSVSVENKPSDMSQELWDEGSVLAHNILARGYTPQGAITGWLNEGYRPSSQTWDTLGHRYALIGVNVSDVQFGYSGSVAIGDCNYEYDNTYKEAISAFPAPGYMPNNTVYPSECAWTVNFDTTKVKAVEVDSVEVKVTNLTTGNSYICSNGNDMAQVNGSSVAFVQPTDNTGTYYTDSYAVEITGLTDSATGNPAIVRYTVKFFDVANLAASPVVSASAVKTNYIIYKTLGDTESLKKIASIIPQEVVVTNDLGKTATIKTTGPWKLDEENKCFVNSAKASDLPATMNDKNNIVSKATISYEISEDYYDMYNTLSINPSSVNIGESVKFTVYRTNISTDSSQIYQLKQDGNGNYYGVKRFDSATSSEFDVENSKDSAYHYYVVNSAKASDAGEYLSVYYSSSKYWDDVYVSTAFKTLTVKSTGTSGGNTGSSGGDTGTSGGNDSSDNSWNGSTGSGSSNTPATPSTPSLSDVNIFYRTHIQTYGWEGKSNDLSTWKSNGAMSGTSGKAKRLEGINIVVNSVDGSSNLDLGVQYTTHCQSYGWLPWSANGEMNGTEGEAKRLEAIKIQLTGADAQYYDIYYRVHAQTYGWLGWAKNGAPAGTAGYAKRLEGIQIVVVKKGDSFNQKMGGITSGRGEAFVAKAGSSPIVNYAPTNNTNPVVPGTEDVNVAYRTHVQSYGWQAWKYNGQMSGTSGKSKRLEGINIELRNQKYSGDIVYTTHVQKYGWQGSETDQTKWFKNGAMAGTSGEAKRLEAICINLTGEMGQRYDIYYRVHAQSYGWLGWAKNGAPAGTAGYGKRLEGIQIVLVPKGGAAPGDYQGIKSTDARAYVEK